MAEADSSKTSRSHSTFINDNAERVFKISFCYFTYLLVRRILPFCMAWGFLLHHKFQLVPWPMRRNVSFAVFDSYALDMKSSIWVRSSNPVI